MFRKQTAAILSGLCLLVIACDTADRDLTAPAAENSASDIQSGSLLAPSNTWITRQPMPKARFNHAAGSLDGVIYVVGGQRFGTTFAGVAAYSVATNAWSAAASLPHPRIRLNGVSAVGGKLYVAGGISGNSIAVRTLYVYDPGTNTWSRKADMPVGGGCGVQGVIDGKLYVYVGCSSGSEPPHFYRYNHTKDQWTTLASPNSNHLHGAGGAIAGKFYLVGTIDGAVPPDRLEVYDPATDTWTFKARMPDPSSHVMAGTVLQGKLYVAGGIKTDHSGDAQATLRVYNPATDTWTLKAPMPSPRSWMAATAAGGKVFVLGGLDSDETVLNRVIAYTP